MTDEIRRSIIFLGKRHPAEPGAAEVTRCLSPLAVEDKVAASKPNLKMGATSAPR